MSRSPAQAYADAAGLAAGLPALMLAAERAAQAVAPGAHGLRRPGTGEDFWQYRPAHDSDSARSIDWRRSARSDARFVRDRERQSARALSVWVSPGAGMGYAGAGRESKRNRARLLALGAAILALRAGERAGLIGEPPRQGMQRAEAIARALLAQGEGGTEAPAPALIRPGSIHLLLGDYLGGLDGLRAALERAAALGAGGLLMQVLHPDEEDFPFDGAVSFATPTGDARHETRDAGGLRDAYRARLAARRDQLAQMAAGAGWHFATHRLDATPALGLQQVYGALTL